MLKLLSAVLSMVFVLTSAAYSGSWTEYPVYPTSYNQLNPDVYNGVVVWQQEVEYEGAYDWDILGADLFDLAVPYPIYVAYYADNQTNPSIWGNWVIWEDDTYGTDDIDVHLTSIANPNDPTNTLLTNYYDNQVNPVVHGNTALWQDPYTDPDTGQKDWDIYGADLTDIPDPNFPIYRVTGTVNDETLPALYHTTAVWADNEKSIESADIWLRNQPDYKTVSNSSLTQTAPAIDGNWVVFERDYTGGDIDIYAVDISDPDNPAEYSLVSNAASQVTPDISGHIVVWADNRLGNWDIYGYNLVTKQEFPIVEDPADQTNPAIWGNLVVWEDVRDGVSNIYYAELEGVEIADCTNVPAGDTDGNCRVDLADIALIAESWLTCNLDPVEACL